MDVEPTVKSSKVNFIKDDPSVIIDLYQKFINHYPRPIYNIIENAIKLIILSKDPNNYIFNIDEKYIYFNNGVKTPLKEKIKYAVEILDMNIKTYSKLFTDKENINIFSNTYNDIY